MIFFYKHILLLICLVISHKGFSQISDLEPKELVLAYKKAIPYPQEVFSGGQYALGEVFQVEGTPYLESNDFIKSNLTINGFTFGDVLLNYNIQKDQLVTFHPTNFQRIILNTEKISSFNLGKKRFFIRLEQNDGYVFHKSGYYEVIWDKELLVLAKHFKVDRLKKDYNASELKHFEFIYNTHYFIKLEKQLFRINKKKDVANALGIPKARINKILRQKQLRFKKQTTESLAAIAAQYASDRSKN